MDDSFDLERFVEAQNRDGTYDAAVSELGSGRKRSHWMWFVFPQIRGLGTSWAAQHYGIASRDEAAAYLAHDVLGPRLRRCARLVVESGAASAEALMGSVDALKLRSSMTLFAEIADSRFGDSGFGDSRFGDSGISYDERDFVAVLDEYYGGERDAATLRLLERG